MYLPNLSKGVNRALILGSRSPKGGGVLPQLRIGVFTEAEVCYSRCRSNGGGDLICRFFCGLRPFTIGGLLIAQ